MPPKKLSDEERRVIRLDWLRRKTEKAIADYHFANGYRAGLECAFDAIKHGRNILDYSIDDGKADIR